MSETVPAPLSDTLYNRSLALFIGADLPQSLTGLPPRRALAQAMAGHFGVPASDSLAQVAQYVSQGGSRFEFIDFLRRRLDTAQIKPAAFHQQVAALVSAYHLETLISCAYDDLLERAFQSAGLAFNRLVRGGDASFINPGRPTLVRLYGDLAQPDTLVVTERDHFNLLRDRERDAVVDEAQSALKKRTVLFLGYDLSDPDFRFIFDQVAQGRLARLAYAAWPGLAEIEKRTWRDLGVAILEIEPLALLQAWNQATPQPTPATQPPSGPTEGSGIHIGSISGVSGGTVNIPGRDNIHNVSTGGSAYASSSVSTQGGDFVGRDKNVYGAGRAMPAAPTHPPAQAEVAMLTRHYPTAYCRQLDAAGLPFLSVTVSNPAQVEASVRISAVIDYRGDSVSKLLAIPPRSQRKAVLLPRLRDEVIRNLNDVSPADLKVQVEQHEPQPRLVYEDSLPFKLQARDVALLAVRRPDGEQIDLSRYLAAWVTPRAPALDHFLGGVLAAHSKVQFIGYQSPKAERVREQVAAIYQSLKEQANLRYVVSSPPAGGESGEILQRVRLPAYILGAGGIANCLEGTALFASLLELINLQPLIVLWGDGGALHAFLGWRLAQATEDYEFLDTVRIGDADFANACRDGRFLYDDAVRNNCLDRPLYDPAGFLRIIDVAACRQAGIHPLDYA